MKERTEEKTNRGPGEYFNSKPQHGLPKVTRVERHMMRHPAAREFQSQIAQREAVDERNATIAVSDFVDTPHRAAYRESDHFNDSQE
jgi:predicted 2-oxoglutarate/Fe(II)-dependent dioxygenase YbiX